ncbi:MAG: hypothetical protein AAGI38_17165 [Bacteroidota bacterium]
MRPVFLGILIFCVMGRIQGQISDKLMPHFGFMFEYVTLNPVDPNLQGFETNYVFSNINIGAYYVAGHKADFISGGIDASTQFGLRITNGGVSWMAQLPVFLMGRLGANSTPYNEQSFGIGAGLGAVVSYLDMNGLEGIDPIGNVIDFGFNQLFVNPSAVIELTLVTGGGPIVGRIHFSLSRPTHDGTLIDGNTITSGRAEYNNFGLGIIYGF